MATLKELIAQGPTSSLSSGGDRWHLCYDTHVKQFYIEHIIGSVRSANQHPSATIKEYDVASWHGPGAAGIPEAIARLLERKNS